MTTSLQDFVNTYEDQKNGDVSLQNVSPSDIESQQKVSDSAQLDQRVTHQRVSGSAQLDQRVTADTLQRSADETPGKRRLPSIHPSPEISGYEQLRRESGVYEMIPEDTDPVHSYESLPVTAAGQEGTSSKHLTDTSHDSTDLRYDQQAARRNEPIMIFSQTVPHMGYVVTDMGHVVPAVGHMVPDMKHMVPAVDYLVPSSGTVSQSVLAQQSPPYLVLTDEDQSSDSQTADEQQADSLLTADLQLHNLSGAHAMTSLTAPIDTADYLKPDLYSDVGEAVSSHLNVSKV